MYKKNKSNTSTSHKSQMTLTPDFFNWAQENKREFIKKTRELVKAGYILTTIQ